MYLDTDVYFSMFNLSYLFRAMEQIDNEYYILNSQLLRLWDESWNMISTIDIFLWVMILKFVELWPV